MSVGYWTFSAAFLLMMASLGLAHTPLSADYHVTSYGSSVLLDCLALRSALTIPQELDLSSAIQPAISSSSSDQASGSEVVEEVWLPEVDLGMNFVHWILPDLRTVEDNSSTIPDVDIIEGTDGSIMLRISFIRPVHLGDYICHAHNMSSNQRVYSRSRIFFLAPPIWQEYRKNFITALIASGSTLVLTTLLCIIHSLRWRPTDDDDSDDDDGKPTSLLVVGRDLERNDEPAAGRIATNRMSSVDVDRDGKINEGFKAEGSTSM